MKNSASPHFQSFRSVLKEKLEPPPLSKDDATASFSEGTELGLGLLNELFHGLRRKARPLAPAFQKPPEPPPPPRKTPTSREKTALDFFAFHGAQGLNPDSTNFEFKRGFRCLARKFHPDAHPNSSEPRKKELSELFRALKQHYSVLEKLASRPG